MRLVRDDGRLVEIIPAAVVVGVILPGSYLGVIYGVDAVLEAVQRHVVVALAYGILLSGCVVLLSGINRIGPVGGVDVRLLELLCVIGLSPPFIFDAMNYVIGEPDIFDGAASVDWHLYWLASGALVVGIALSIGLRIAAHREVSAIRDQIDKLERRGANPGMRTHGQRPTGSTY